MAVAEVTATAPETPTIARARPAGSKFRVTAMTRADVIALNTLGYPKTRIARELGIARSTVLQIVKQSTISHLTEEAKKITSVALPDSARAVVGRVEHESNNPQVVPTASLAVLKGFGVLQDGPTININAHNAAIIMGSVPEGLNDRYQLPAQVIDAQVVNPLAGDSQAIGATSATDPTGSTPDPAS